MSSINHLFFVSVCHLLFTCHLTIAIIYLLSIFIILAQKPHQLLQNNEQSISTPTRKFATRICRKFVRESVGSLWRGSRIKKYLDFLPEKNNTRACLVLMFRAPEWTGPLVTYARTFWVTHKSGCCITHFNNGIVICFPLCPFLDGF